MRRVRPKGTFHNLLGSVMSPPNRVIVLSIFPYIRTSIFFPHSTLLQDIFALHSFNTQEKLPGIKEWVTTLTHSVRGSSTKYLTFYVRLYGEKWTKMKKRKHESDEKVHRNSYKLFIRISMELFIIIYPISSVQTHIKC